MSPSGGSTAPEARADERLGRLLTEAGWLVQDREDITLTVGDAGAVREFPREA